MVFMQFLPKAQEVALKSEAEGNSIDTKLQKVSTELHEVIEAQLQVVYTLFVHLLGFIVG